MSSNHKTGCLKSSIFLLSFHKAAVTAAPWPLRGKGSSPQQLSAAGLVKVTPCSLAGTALQPAWMWQGQCAKAEGFPPLGWSSSPSCPLPAGQWANSWMKTQWEEDTSLFHFFCTAPPWFQLTKEMNENCLLPLHHFTNTQPPEKRKQCSVFCPCEKSFCFFLQTPSWACFWASLLL